MINYNGMKAETRVTSSPLPAGGYIGKIMNVELAQYSWGQQLILSLDIAEGEHKDFFAKQYRSNPNEDRKWKGVYRITIPQEGNQYFDSQRRSFNYMLRDFEDSNTGFQWNGDESKLKGKLIGLLYRNREWTYNGRTGWTTECCSTVSVDRIRSGDFTVPADKPLKATAAVSTSPASLEEAIDTDEDLPF